MTVLVVLGVLAVLALAAWSQVVHRSIAVELAARPEHEYNVAGLRKADEVGRHAWWSTTPWRLRRLRRRLDTAAATIARFEADRRREPPELT